MTTVQQIRKLADIFSDIAQVSLASIVVPFLLSEYRPLAAITALAASLAFWFVSLVLLRYDDRS